MIVPTLEEAYRQHRQRVYMLCLKFLRDPNEAEDWTQDVFLHLATRLHSFQGKSAFSTWMHRVTVNYCLMRVRNVRDTWHRRLLSLEEMADDPDGSDDLNRAVLCHDEMLATTAERLTVQGALKEMPVKLRTAFELCVQEGYTAAEAGAALGVMEGTAKSRLQRARIRVRKELS